MDSSRATGRESAGLVRLGPEVRVVRAPGRVNVIGEHTDYNDGLVLPAAIDLGITISFTPIDEPVARLTLTGTGETVTIDLDRSASPRGDWTDYVAGTAWAIRDAGGRVGGFLGNLASDLPQGEGLSSSAALELASAWAMGGGEAPLADRMALARACRRAENEFVGVPCGLMDQFAVAFGEPGSAILLDCRSLEHRAVRFPDSAALLVAESGLQRGLRRSSYARRREDCTAAAAILAGLDPAVRSLRDATPELLEAARVRLGEVRYRRARHVVGENERVGAVVRALDDADLATAGQALLASHASLRDDFEVSTPELDALVDVAAVAPGVLGARLTGAGFGGSIIVLAQEALVDVAIESIRTGYRTPAGDPPVVRRVLPSAGAGAVGPEAWIEHR